MSADPPLIGDDMTDREVEQVKKHMEETMSNKATRQERQQAERERSQGNWSARLWGTRAAQDRQAGRDDSAAERARQRNADRAVEAQRRLDRQQDRRER